MNSRGLDDVLKQNGVVVLDGAQGTELERRGVSLGSSKLWSAQLLIDDPDLVRTIHLDYLRAGADVITTFTYQASPQGFAEAGVDAARAAQLLNMAVDLAHSARTQFLQEQEQEQTARAAEAAPAIRTEESREIVKRAAGTEEQLVLQGDRRAQPPCMPGRQDSAPATAAAGGARNTGSGSAEAPTRSSATGTAAAVTVAVAPSRCRPLVAFSCGSYGGYLADGSEFRGDYADAMTLEQLADFHRARLDPVRHRTEIDLLAFETVPCAKEAEAIVALLRAQRYGKPAWISFSCRDGEHTCHGELFAERCIPLLAAAAAEGLVVAAGVNCTAPRHVGPLLAAARAKLRDCCCPVQQQPCTASDEHKRQPEPEQGRELLLLCYPNSGEEWDGQGRCWRHVPDDIAEPERFAAAARDWVRGGPGVALVGGCCRTCPDHIRMLRRELCLGSGSQPE